MALPVFDVVSSDVDYFGSHYDDIEASVPHFYDGFIDSNELPTPPLYTHVLGLLLWFLLLCQP